MTAVDFRPFIAGSYVESTTGGLSESIDPSTGEAVGRVANAGASEAEDALRAAREAHDDRRWASLSGTSRAKVLFKIAEGIRERGPELADLETRDSGATRAKARSDVSSASFWFRTMAELAERLDEPEPLPITLAPIASSNFLQREPVGVGVAIIPWNFPLLMAAWKLSMGLAAGNSMILKPAPETPATATMLAGIAAEAGVPDGVVNVLPGPGPGLGDLLVGDPRVDKVSFTGSPQVGKQVAAAAAATVKNVTLELGGKSPQLILPDADLELGIDGALFAIFFHSGQTCTAGSRLLVPAAMHADVVDRLFQRAANLVVGPADDEVTNLGPLISQRHLERVEAHIMNAAQEGATIALGGSRPTVRQAPKGYYLNPTIITDVTPEMRIAQDEVFGPVLTVLPYEDVDEAVAVANGTAFGLAAGIWGSTAMASRVASRLRAGTVWINDYHLLSPKYPFGGMGQSGVGREHGQLGLHEWTEARHVHISLDPARTAKRYFDGTVPPGIDLAAQTWRT